MNTKPPKYFVRIWRHVEDGREISVGSMEIEQRIREILMKGLSAEGWTCGRVAEMDELLKGLRQKLSHEAEDAKPADLPADPNPWKPW